MTAYDFYMKHGLCFASGVNLLNNAATKKDLTGPALAMLNKRVSKGGRPSEYERGKMEGALKKIQVPEDIQAILASHTQSFQGLQRPVEIQITTGAEPQPDSVHEVTFPGYFPKEAKDPRTIALHKEHSHHHALMVAAQTDEDRAMHAVEIMQRIIPTLDNLYKGPKTETPAEAPAPTGGAADFRKLQSLRTRISRLRNELIPNAPTMARKLQLETELQEKLDAAALLEETL